MKNKKEGRIVNLITEQILLDNDFEIVEAVSPLGIKLFRKWIDIGKIDIDGGMNGEFMNTDEKWNVHVDNLSCNSIANVELSTIRQFNLLMEIVHSVFRLK